MTRTSSRVLCNRGLMSFESIVLTTIKTSGRTCSHMHEQQSKNWDAEFAF